MCRGVEVLRCRGRGYRTRNTESCRPDSTSSLKSTDRAQGRTPTSSSPATHLPRHQASTRSPTLVRRGSGSGAAHSALVLVIPTASGQPPSSRIERHGVVGLVGSTDLPSARFLLHLLPQSLTRSLAHSVTPSLPQSFPHTLPRCLSRSLPCFLPSSLPGLPRQSPILSLLLFSLLPILPSSLFTAPPNVSQPVLTHLPRHPRPRPSPSQSSNTLTSRHRRLPLPRRAFSREQRGPRHGRCGNGPGRGEGEV